MFHHKSCFGCLFFCSWSHISRTFSTSHLQKRTSNRRLIHFLRLSWFRVESLAHLEADPDHLAETLSRLGVLVYTHMWLLCSHPPEEPQRGEERTRVPFKPTERCVRESALMISLNHSCDSVSQNGLGKPVTWFSQGFAYLLHTYIYIIIFLDFLLP